jgi:hypothetical protein
MFRFFSLRADIVSFGGSDSGSRFLVFSSVQTKLGERIIIKKLITFVTTLKLSGNTKIQPNSREDAKIFRINNELCFELNEIKIGKMKMN